MLSCDTDFIVVVDHVEKNWDIEYDTRQKKTRVVKPGSNNSQQSWDYTISGSRPIN